MDRNVLLQPRWLHLSSCQCLCPQTKHKIHLIVNSDDTTWTMQSLVSTRQVLHTLKYTNANPQKIRLDINDMPAGNVIHFFRSSCKENYSLP
jgi:hypothetical protein